MQENYTNIILSIYPKLTREAYTTLLNSFNSFRVIAGIGDGIDLVNKYIEIQPDIIVTNLVLSGMNGLEAVREIRKNDSELKSILLSEFSNWGIIEECFNAGVNGFISADDEFSKLAKAIDIVLSGENFYPYYFPITSGNKKQNSSLNEYDFKKLKILLTNREEEVFRLYGNGYTTGEISDMLNLSRKTVEFHEYQIKNKLEIRSINKLVYTAAINNFMYDHK